MTWEVFRDPRGSTTDSEGRPYNESLTTREARRGLFVRWGLERNPEVREPQTPLPKDKQPTSSGRKRNVFPPEGHINGGV